MPGSPSDPVGQQIASLLRGAWREHPPALDVPEAVLETASPVLLASGCAGLLWRRLKNSPLRSSPTSARFRDVYRYATLYSARLERGLAEVVILLRREGIEPVLTKGWSVARLYPDRGLRPYVDLDLCVRPQDYARAGSLLAAAPEGRLPVELHRGFEKNLFDADAEPFYRRSRLAPLGDLPVRILAAEDSFRLLCLHLWNSRAWRPLWLCDVALVIETLPAGFDWDLALAGPNRSRDWVTRAIQLAHVLLGASLDRTPLARDEVRLPGWLIPEVLREWERCAAPPLEPLERVASVRPNRLVREAVSRWRSPLAAAAELRLPLDDRPRLPYQALATARRGISILRRARGEQMERGARPMEGLPSPDAEQANTDGPTAPGAPATGGD